MTFEKVLNGITRYLNAEIYSGMNDWQEMFARIAVSRILGNAETIKTTLINNPFIQTFAIMDANGNVDVDGLMSDIRRHIEQKGKLTVALPMFGNFTFTTEDVNKLHQAIMEG